MSEAGTQPGLVLDSNSGRSPRALVVRVALTAAALVIWFATQSWIGARSLPASGIGDGLQAATAPVNSYLLTHPGAANVLLFVSSGIVDILGIFLLAKWIFGASLRPFLGLVIVLGLRQIMQACVALPPPPHAIWHNPGFPSIFVTYSVAHDYFFSGHTAIAVLGAGELVRVGRSWLTAAAVGIVGFEIFAVVALRAHYTMDVFTGAVTALYAMHLAQRFR
ncbi:MAG TPA: phosphatase PAP2-related protein [Candidatus Sulfotelmatobacter sp.]|nr:phosphatase PAP2-related protein [Candidatus Sulfotelmatobacter sp.]